MKKSLCSWSEAYGRSQTWFGKSPPLQLSWQKADFSEYISTRWSLKAGSSLRIFQVGAEARYLCIPSNSKEGFRDINRARVKRAEDYLLHCDEIFVVAPISRAVSDKRVKRFIQTYSQHSASNKRRDISVVCTHAEVGSLLPFAVVLY